MTASSIGWTPLFLNAEPHSTGTNEPASVPLRMARLISASESSSSPRYFSITSSSSVAMVSSSLSRHSSAVGLVIGGDLLVVVLGALLVAVPDDGDHAHEVDEAGEVRLRADRQLDDRRRGLEPVLDHVDGAVEVGADAVHLVDEAHARHVVLVGLAPHGLGLRLDAGDRVEHGDGAVEHAQRTLDLDREVDVTGRVDDVDAVVVPERGGGGGGDRDAALLLLGHVVHDGGAVVYLTDLVGLAGVVEDALRRGGLAGIDVGHDADVAVALERELSLGHGQTSSLPDRLRNTRTTRITPSRVQPVLGR